MTQEGEGPEDDRTLRTERVVAAPPRAVFGAFSDPRQLAMWWGPNGFRNTFERFEFAPGGKWVFTMHGPDGKDYANDSSFREVVPDERVVIHHVSPPRFTLTVSLEAQGPTATRVLWKQTFESARVAESLRKLAQSANEQNLDRLEAVVAAQSNDQG